VARLRSKDITSYPRASGDIAGADEKTGKTDTDEKKIQHENPP
jgi:hypothetical protein